MLKNSSISIDQVVEILTESLIDDPNFSYIFGGNSPSYPTLKAFLEPFVTDGFYRGQIIVEPNQQGACIWYPAEVDIYNQQFEKTLTKIIDTVRELAGQDSAERFEHLIKTVGQHEATQKHCEVFFLGLKPEFRGKGIGKSLLKAVLHYADTHQVGCYLVSSNTRNISFYERNGFEKYCSIKISDSYSMTGMWRNPSS
ncbi:GCN5-related N-acetyltransferase [Gloeothece citriformis PCC 7424]|uniref:GCN5-related N-acetyltransferase n=1 Tax=Gloeothece citriformis (strain PCC 7424) TaxID=65393 RepID=B7KEC0_GLOC7|nr:GNAT family N-acetyltransferase [Gloeothece citriformis]ACK73238.1 GCN5-related N-acetyltransferase [Gloeothece citriformis PCC 7424]